MLCLYTQHPTCLFIGVQLLCSQSLPHQLPLLLYVYTRCCCFFAHQRFFAAYVGFWCFSAHQLLLFLCAPAKVAANTRCNVYALTSCCFYTQTLLPLCTPAAAVPDCACLQGPTPTRVKAGWRPHGTPSTPQSPSCWTNWTACCSTAPSTWVQCCSSWQSCTTLCQRRYLSGACMPAGTCCAM